MKLSIFVIGLGYIGLPAVSLLATEGYKVTGGDIDPKVVESISQGNVHIVEPDLDVLVRSAVNSGNLVASIQHPLKRQLTSIGNLSVVKCITTDARTAEMAKLIENSFRDVNIAFANVLSMICDELKINVWDMISLANRYPRVNILNPGPGVGGHCIAVDPWFIVPSAPQHSRLIRTAREVNDYKLRRFFQC